MTAWTQERFDWMLEMWRAGRSASYIAVVLGQRLTRNAVISKLHRTGNAERDIVPRASKVQWIAPAPAPAMQAPEHPLIALANNACRWPIGDPREPDFHYCGAKRAPNRCYCTDHVKDAYVGRARVVVY